MLEFNIAPNTQIGRINIWNPTKAKYVLPEIDEVEIGGKLEKIKPYPARGLTVGETYYLRKDNDDNGFIDVYKDYKYTQFVTRLYLNPTAMNQDQFVPKYWEIKEVKIYNNEDSFHTEHYMRSGEFIENLVCDNMVEFGKRWLGLAGLNDFLTDMQEYYQRYYTSYSQNGWYGFSHYYPETKELVECPVIDMGNKKAVPAVTFSNEPERPFRLFRMAKDNEVNLNETRYNKKIP